LTAGLSALLVIFTGYLFHWIDQFDTQLDPSPIPGSMRISPVDGMISIYIPEGDFLMGDSRDMNSSPLHRVYLDAYWIDQTEVTNAMFENCIAAGACAFSVHQAKEEIHFGEPAYANDPIVYITWYDAVTYCQWAGRRLPTEAEWEKAARGTDLREYPWGDSSPERFLLNFDNLVGDTTPVGTFLAGASPYGVLDMAGNVREWVADWYGASYYKISPWKNPQGPASGEMRVLRGGSYIDNFQRVRAAKRFEHLPDSGGVNRGFRCVTPIWMP
jgi:formylglycine-generating enzyme required for sulfatase activity